MMRIQLCIYVAALIGADALLAQTQSKSALPQQPDIFDISTVAVGAQRLETQYAFAVGYWSDSRPELVGSSTKIECYQRFGFCQVAEARWLDRFVPKDHDRAFVLLNSFDVLRWDKSEVIAVDSEYPCEVQTLRLDIAARKVTLSSVPKGNTDLALCKEATSRTAFLLGATPAGPVPRQ